jgi:hypothetical protein
MFVACTDHEPQKWQSNNDYAPAHSVQLKLKFLYTVSQKHLMVFEMKEHLRQSGKIFNTDKYIPCP